MTPTLLPDATARLVDRREADFARHDDRFDAARSIVRHLGAHWSGDHAAFGFWTPEIDDEAEVHLELLTPSADADPATPGEVAFERALVEPRRAGEFAWAAVEGVRPGTRDRLGTLYRLRYEHDGESHTVMDPLAASLPFGAFAPAELYDLALLDRERGDRDYFESLGGSDPSVPVTVDDWAVADPDAERLPRIDAPTSMLEVHPGTATVEGSLGALARLYERLGEKLRAGEAPTPMERNFLGYDAIQLMPVEPITENPETDPFWTERIDDDELVATVDPPTAINWGYDVVVAGFGAVNPCILESGRPDELVDLIAACHAMPDPVRVVFDVALGHADDRALELLDRRYFAGPGMYGQNLDYTEPVVRAVLLELQRRKMDFGADGIRVDGAQDFTNWDPGREEEVHDDAYLASMDAVTQEMAGQRYKPWLVYEDGRPWPRQDWELASTYRELIDRHPHSFQWGPVTFAHNTPALVTFWASKWWRVREVADLGGHWITSVANHDTVRRGTQQPVAESWEGRPHNPYLGETPPDALDAAYDNPATNALFHCFLPGVPMDFTHANARAPWGFVRDTDPTWNVKVVADEHNLPEWQIRPEHWTDERFFSRLKALGFETREELVDFAASLASAVEATDYDLDRTAGMLAALDTPLGDPSPEDLEAFGYAWMRDVHDFANLGNWSGAQDDGRTAFDLSVRRFRQDRPWLRADLGSADRFGYRHPADGTILYHGYREGPDEAVLYCGNVEGTPVTVTPASLAPDDAAGSGDWTPAVVAPGLDDVGADAPLTLDNARAVVFTRPS